MAVLPAIHTFIHEWNEPSCLYTQPQSITALWLVVNTCPTESRRLSWPSWLVTYRGGMTARSVVCVWSVCLSACRLITFESPAKTAKPIEMQFEGLTRVDPRSHLLDGGRDSYGKGHFMVVRSTEKHWESMYEPAYNSRTDNISTGEKTV